MTDLLQISPIGSEAAPLIRVFPRRTKASAIPLCRRHHTTYPNSYHVLGRVRFEAVHGVSVALEVIRLQSRAEACGIDLTPRREPQSARRGQIRRIA